MANDDSSAESYCCGCHDFLIDRVLRMNFGQSNAELAISWFLKVTTAAQGSPLCDTSIVRTLPNWEKWLNRLSIVFLYDGTCDKYKVLSFAEIEGLRNIVPMLL